MRARLAATDRFLRRVAHSPCDAAKLGALFRREVEKWSEVIKQASLKAE